MTILRKIRRAVRGEVKPRTIVLELIRRRRAGLRARRERLDLDRINLEIPKVRLTKNKDLLTHFRTRVEPRFFPGFSLNSVTRPQTNLFPDETNELLCSARRIVDDHAWPLLGFGVTGFGKEIEWRRDPLSGYVWPLDYHRDIQLIRNDGSDARVLWEVNRLGHLLTLARAYQLTLDEDLSQECFRQLETWAEQNPYGRGVNWGCAMEVALRSMNLLAVFESLKHSSRFTVETLALFLRLFHQHGTYIRNNLEFTYISTSNHYLSDVTGLLWLGIMLPEFREGENWFDFGFREMLLEMEKQVLPDGADFEASTGYHRFVLELFLYSFILCTRNDRKIASRYWSKLHRMLEYLRGYLRPDGLAPLIGDSDSGQVLPIWRRRANEHAYVLAIGAATFKDSDLRMPNLNATPELVWLLGDEGLDNFQSLAPREAKSSEAFPHAGTYLMCRDDLYLCLNASSAGLNGRGSHGHNDALSIEVSAGGRPFIIDPGSYIYTADLRQRHLFRSTAYHSTVKIDGAEQNTTIESIPFVIGNEANPKVLAWETGSDFDRIVAEHSGYSRLSSPVIHRRTIVFNRIAGEWTIEDEFLGEGEHGFEIRFHFAPDLKVAKEISTAKAIDLELGLGFSVTSLDLEIEPTLEEQAASEDYGNKTLSVSACWRVTGRFSKLRWQLIPTTVVEA